MKLFHFLPEIWALEAIKKQRLKVSKYSDLNDPFELVAMSLDDKIERTAINAKKKELNKIFRVLCCSGNWQSPLLWAHYGDKHKGVALELEVPERRAEAISYRKSREKVSFDELFPNPDKEPGRRFLKLCNTKYIEWGYEDEYRIQFTEEDFYSDDEFDFYDLGKDIKITGIVLGALNKLTESKIKNVIPNGHHIFVTTTRIAFKSFNIVKRKDKPIYTVYGVIANKRIKVDMNIRRYRNEDRESLIALWCSIFPDDPPHNEPSSVIFAKLAVDDLIFVAESNGDLVGACMAGYDGHRGWLYAVGVLPEYRRSGAGSSLVKFAMNALKEIGCIKVNLQIRSTNTEAAAFYQSLGFIEDRLSMSTFIEQKA